MKTLTLAAAAIAILAGTSAFGQAPSNYPTRQVRIVANSTPGASIDISARLVASWLEKRLKQPFVVENKPGGNGTIGANEVVRSEPDGYTLLVAASSIEYADLTIKELPYDWRKDIKPVAKIAGAGLMLTVASSVPAKNLAEFVAYAKARPGALNQGNAGSLHPVMEEVKSLLGIEIQNVMYKGGAPVTAALASDEIQLAFLGTFQTLALEKLGKARAIAFTSDKRDTRFPSIPTIAESGFPGFNGGFWIGLFVRTSVPAAIVDRLNAEVNAMNKDPASLKVYESQGYETYDARPDQIRAQMLDEAARAAKAFTKAGVKPE